MTYQIINRNNPFQPPNSEKVIIIRQFYDYAKEQETQAIKQREAYEQKRNLAKEQKNTEEEESAHRLMEEWKSTETRINMAAKVIEAFMWLKVNLYGTLENGKKEREAKRENLGQVLEAYQKYRAYTGPRAAAPHLGALGSAQGTPVHLENYNSTEHCKTALTRAVEDVVEDGIKWTTENNQLKDFLSSFTIGCCIESHVRSISQFIGQARGTIPPNVDDLFAKEQAELTKEDKELTAELFFLSCLKYLGAKVQERNEVITLEAKKVTVEPANSAQVPSNPDISANAGQNLDQSSYTGIMNEFQQSSLNPSNTLELTKEKVQSLGKPLTIDRILSGMKESMLFDEKDIERLPEQHQALCNEIMRFKQEFLSPLKSGLNPSLIDELQKKLNIDQNYLITFAAYLTEPEVEIIALAFATTGKWDLVITLVKVCKPSIKFNVQESVNLQTLLYKVVQSILAGKNELTPLAEMLVKRGADIVLLDEQGLSPLANAIWGANIKLANLLLEGNNRAQCLGSVLLELAKTNNIVALINFCLHFFDKENVSFEHIKDKNKVKYFLGLTLSILAAHNVKYWGIIEKLLSLPYEIEFVYLASKHSPFFHLITDKQSEHKERLIQLYLNKMRNYKLALSDMFYHSALSKRWDLLRIIYQPNQQPQNIASNPQTKDMALHTLAQEKKEEENATDALQFLLDNKIITVKYLTFYKNKADLTPLEIVLLSDNLKMFDRLTKYFDQDSSQVTKILGKALLSLAQQKRWATIERLLCCHHEIEFHLNLGQSAFMHLLASDNSELKERLIKLYLNKIQGNKAALDDAFYYSAFYKRWDLLKIIYKPSDKPDPVRKAGETALHLLVKETEQEAVDTLQFLLDNGIINPDLFTENLNDKRLTPLDEIILADNQKMFLILGTYLSPFELFDEIYPHKKFKFFQLLKNICCNERTFKATTSNDEYYQGVYLACCFLDPSESEILSFITTKQNEISRYEAHLENALTILAATQAWEGVSNLLNSKYFNLITVEERLTKALSFVCEYNQLQFLQPLLQKIMTSEGRSLALLYLIQYKHWEEAILLTKTDFEILILSKKEEYNTAFHLLACEEKEQELAAATLHALCEKATPTMIIRLTSPNKHGCSALYIAIVKRNIPVMVALARYLPLNEIHNDILKSLNDDNDVDDDTILLLIKSLKDKKQAVANLKFFIRINRMDFAHEFLYEHKNPDKIKAKLFRELDVQNKVTFLMAIQLFEFRKIKKNINEASEFMQKATLEFEETKSEKDICRLMLINYLINLQAEKPEVAENLKQNIKLLLKSILHSDPNHPDSILCQNYEFIFNYFENSQNRDPTTIDLLLALFSDPLTSTSNLYEKIGTLLNDKLKQIYSLEELRYYRLC